MEDVVDGLVDDDEIQEVVVVSSFSLQSTDGRGNTPKLDDRATANAKDRTVL